MEPIPYRIRIGVTGKRKNLPERLLVEAVVTKAIGWDGWDQGRSIAPESLFALIDRRSLDALRSLKHTHLGLSVLTSLAEGADRIVADVVNGIDGSRTEIILPMPVVDYEGTFKNAAGVVDRSAVEEFRTMLLRDRRPHIVSPTPLDENSRHKAYFKAGKVIVDQCDVLIAIWDGVEKKGAGGTSDAIAYARGDDRKDDPAFMKDPNGKERPRWRKPVIIIRTDKDLSLESDAGTHIHLPDVAMLDALNGTAAEPGDEEKGRVKLEKLIGEPSKYQHFAQAGAIEAIKKYLLPLYMRTSKLAADCKKAHERQGMAVYILAAFAVLFVAIGWMVEPFRVAAYVIEAVLLSVILGIILFAHWRKTHHRWLQHRFLAERCRAAFYLQLLEARPSIARPFDMLIEKDDDAWVVRAFEEVQGTIEDARPAGAGEMKPGELEDAKAFIRIRLLDDQIGHHSTRKKEHADKAKAYSIWLVMTFGAALLLALIHLVTHMEDFPAWGHAIGPILTIGSIMLPVIAGAIEGIRSQREFSRRANVSKRMEVELTGLKEQLAEVTDVAQFNELLQAIDQSLMRESAEWLALMIHTEVELKP